MHNVFSQGIVLARHDKVEAADDGQGKMFIKGHQGEGDAADGINTVLGNAPVHGGLGNGEQGGFMGFRRDAEILRRLHEVVNGFADAPEQNADADAGTQRDGKPAEKAEVGFCVPSAYAYAPNRRTDDAEGEQHDKEAEKHRSPPKILDNLVLQQVHEADKGLRKRDGAHDKRKNG